MSRLLRRQRGFTLIELLIVIAIIGIIAAILIPNFLDSLQKAKQKRTMGDMKDTGTAMFSWMTDQFGAAAAAGQTKYTMPAEWAYAAAKVVLSPQYIQKLPEKDAWNGAYKYCKAADVLTAETAIGIISLGRDGKGASACATEVDAGVFEPTDYDRDLVWADGHFVHYPQKLTGGGS